MTAKCHKLSINDIAGRLRLGSPNLVVIFSPNTGIDGSFCGHLMKSKKAKTILETDPRRVVGVFNGDFDAGHLFEACQMVYHAYYPNIEFSFYKIGEA